jgi:hypothetical protein
MSNDTKGVETKVEETTNQEALLDEENKVEVKKDDSTASESQEAEESEIDYKAELERVKALLEVKDNRLIKAEHKIVELKKESEESIEENSDDSDPYGVQDIVKREVERITSSLRQDMIGDVIEEELNNLSNSNDEKELIKYHYNNTIKPSGVNRNSIKEDLKSAYLLANQKRFLKENEELRAALKSESTKSKGGTGSNQKPLKAEETTNIKFSAADLAFCKKRGIDPKTIRNEIK